VLSGEGRLKSTAARNASRSISARNRCLSDAGVKRQRAKRRSRADAPRSAAATIAGRGTTPPDRVRRPGRPEPRRFANGARHVTVQDSPILRNVATCGPQICPTDVGQASRELAHQPMRLSGLLRDSVAQFAHFCQAEAATRSNGPNAAIVAGDESFATGFSPA